MNALVDCLFPLLLRLLLPDLHGRITLQAVLHPPRIMRQQAQTGITDHRRASFRFWLAVQSK